MLWGTQKGDFALGRVVGLNGCVGVPTDRWSLVTLSVVGRKTTQSVSRRTQVILELLISHRFGQLSDRHLVFSPRLFLDWGLYVCLNGVVHFIHRNKFNYYGH